MKYITILTLLFLTIFESCQNKDAGLSEYHQALSLIDRGDAPAALDMLEQAGKHATTDSLRALIESQKGTLFFDQHLLDRSLKCYQQAYAIDKHACDTLGLIYDLRDIGNVYRSLDNDSCMACFREAQKLSIAAGFLSMQRDVESQMAGYYLYHNKLQEARQLLIPALDYTDSTNASGLHFMMADLYHRSGSPDSATYYYNKVLNYGTLYSKRGAHRQLADYALMEGNSEQAFYHIKEYGILTDSILGENDAEALRRMTALYDYTLHEQESIRLTQVVIVVGATAIILSLLLVLIIFRYRKRHEVFHLKLQQMELLVAEHQHQTEKVTAVQEQFIKSSVFNRIHQLLNNVSQPSMTEEDWHSLEELFSQVLPRFLTRLQEFSHLTTQERRVSMLVRLGFTPMEIAQLTAHSKQSVTNTRSRLYEKSFGRKGAPSDWDKLILSL